MFSLYLLYLYSIWHVRKLCTYLLLKLTWFVSYRDTILYSGFCNKFFILFFCCVHYLKSAPGFYFLFIGKKARDLGLPTPGKIFFGQHKENLRQGEAPNKEFSKYSELVRWLNIMEIYKKYPFSVKIKIKSISNPRRQVTRANSIKIIAMETLASLSKIKFLYSVSMNDFSS